MTTSPIARPLPPDVSDEINGFLAVNRFLFVNGMICEYHRARSQYGLKDDNETMINQEVRKYSAGPEGGGGGRLDASVVNNVSFSSSTSIPLLTSSVNHAPSLNQTPSSENFNSQINNTDGYKFFSLCCNPVPMGTASIPDVFPVHLTSVLEEFRFPESWNCFDPAVV